MVRTLEIIEGDEQWDTRYTVISQDGRAIAAESVKIHSSEHVDQVLAEEGITRLDAEEGYEWSLRKSGDIVRAEPFPIESEEPTPDRSVVT